MIDLHAIFSGMQNDPIVAFQATSDLWARSSTQTAGLTGLHAKASYWIELYAMNQDSKPDNLLSP